MLRTTYRLKPFSNMPNNTSIRARGWVFTLNNFTPQHEATLARLQCQYIVYGREVGASGTPHLQGYVFYTNKKSRSQVARDIPNAYIDMRKGTHEQARAYSIKDGMYEERGERPLDMAERQKKGGEATSTKWKDIVTNSASGNIAWVADNHPKEYALYKPRLESLYAPINTPLDGDLLHEWWVGTSGSGKSKALWDLYPAHFAKSINKWWDGYRHEDVVAIEEWSPDNTMTAQALKRWADRYPFTGEIKGGTMQRLRPKKIIVLSNYTMDQCFPRAEDLAPLKRRFKVIEFPHMLQHANFRAAWFNTPTTPAALESVEELTECSSTQDPFELPDIDLDYLFSQE